MSWARRIPVPYAFVAPAFVPVLVVVVVPMLVAAYLSLTAFQLLKQDVSFVGLANYGALLADPIFWNSLGTTLVFLVVTVNLSLLVGLALALGVARVGVGQSVMRTLLMVPMMFAPVLVGFQFRWFFNAQVGLVNNALRALGLITEPIAWLVDRNLALISVIAADMWMNVPIVAIIFLAGRLSLPRDLEEAAEIDGANAWQRLRYVALPQLMPFFYVITAIRSLDVARSFDIVQIMTGGGPAHRTELMWTYIFRVSMQDGRFAVGAAMSFITVIITVLALAYVFRQLVKSRIVR